MFTNFSEYQDAKSTEKLVLATIDPAKQLMGWVVHSGSVYVLNNFDYSVIVSIKEAGSAYTEVGSIGAVIASTYYNDRENKKLYLRTSGSVHPNSVFIVMIFRLFYANIPITLPYDLSTGKEVDWLAYIKKTSEFGVEIDNKNQLGFAVDGSGSIDFINDLEYWQPIFDKLTWENKRVHIYSYHRSLPLTEVVSIFDGYIVKKSWKDKTVSFQLKDILGELKQTLELDILDNHPTAVIPDNLKQAKQRLVYGYVYGHVPTNIDHIVENFQGTGTVSATNGSVNITGSGVSFFAQLNPGDQLLIEGSDTYFTVDSVSSNTALTITEAFDGGTGSGFDYYIKPDKPKRFKNRVFLVAGHATKEPSTLVTEGKTLNFFQVASTEDLSVGDKIVVNGETVNIRRISENYIKTLQNLSEVPQVGYVVTRPSVSNVYIDDLELDPLYYSYDATTAELTIDDLAEFSLAKVRPMIGTVTFSGGSNVVTGVGTKFTSEVESSDWIRKSGQFDFFEVLQVIDDTTLHLRQNATYSGGALGQIKKPKIYDDGSVVLSCDLIGKTHNGLKTGTFLKTASDIVKDILIYIGLENNIDLPSFADSKIYNDRRVSLVIPSAFNETKTKTARDYIGDVCESVFGSLVQTSDFKLAFNILAPTRTLSDKKLNESDVIDFTINSDSSKIIKTSKVVYLNKEYDYATGEKLNQVEEHTPDYNNYLTQSSLVQQFESNLVEQSDAKILAQRYAFMLQIARATLNIKTKLQGYGLSVNDRVWLDHEKTYERIGSGFSQKIGAIDSLKKDGSGSNIEIDDLSGAFSRCATVTENTAVEFDLSEDVDKIINGYITDTYGMQDNDPDTFGINLIW